MMTPVVTMIAWVSVVPLAIVDRDLHLRWISVVQIVAAAVVLVTPEVLWVIDVWVVIEPVVVAATRGSTPLLSERLRLLRFARLAGHGPASQTAEYAKNGFANHLGLPPHCTVDANDNLSARAL